jgi:hypothetical protein
VDKLLRGIGWGLVFSVLAVAGVTVAVLLVVLAVNR